MSKRTDANGFNPATVLDRIAWMQKKPPKGNWQKFDKMMPMT